MFRLKTTFDAGIVLNQRNGVCVRQMSAAKRGSRVDASVVVWRLCTLVAGR